MVTKRVPHSDRAANEHSEMPLEERRHHHAYVSVVIPPSYVKITGYNPPTPSGLPLTFHVLGDASPDTGDIRASLWDTVNLIWLDVTNGGIVTVHYTLKHFDVPFTLFNIGPSGSFRKFKVKVVYTTNPNDPASDMGDEITVVIP